MGGPVTPRPFVVAPTPIRPWGDAGLRGRLWIKDEAHAGVLYGGNKVRKLAWLLGDETDRRDLLTMGGVGSHHVLATAIWGASVGRVTHALLFPQPDTAHVRRVARHLQARCASVRPLPDPLRASVALTRAVARVAADTGRPPCVIPVGGSSALGTQGWIDAGRELAAQVRAGACPPPQRVYAPVGSGGTVAGLLAGFALAGFDVELVGVRVVSRALCNPARLRHLARAALRRRGEVAGLGRLRLVHAFFGGGYGVVTGPSAAAVDRGEAQGLPLETTYSGKAFAACLAELGHDAVDAVFVQTASGVEPGEDPPPLRADLERLLR